MEENQITASHLSISHENDMCVAFVILESIFHLFFTNNAAITKLHISYLASNETNTPTTPSRRSYFVAQNSVDGDA